MDLYSTTSTSLPSRFSDIIGLLHLQLPFGVRTSFSLLVILKLERQSFNQINSSFSCVSGMTVLHSCHTKPSFSYISVLVRHLSWKGYTFSFLYLYPPTPYWVTKTFTYSLLLYSSSPRSSLGALLVLFDAWLTPLLRQSLVSSRAPNLCSVNDPFLVSLCCRQAWLRIRCKVGGQQ